MSNGGGSVKQWSLWQLIKCAPCREGFAYGWAQAGNKARAAALDQACRAACDQVRAAYAHARGYDHARIYAHVRAYVSMAVKGSGLLALLLSTVILLGGFVQSLVMEDFFCIMAITVIQAAGIFQDWETNLGYVVGDSADICVSVLGFIIVHMSASVAVLFVILWPFLGLVFCIQLFHFIGPLVCAAISSWRIAKLNHGYNRDGTDSTADMMATLNIFYSLIIFQGTMFLVLLISMSIYYASVISHIHSLEQLPDKWGKDAISRYISHISAKCVKDPLSIQGMDLIKYGADLLDSESQENYLYGARLLSSFVKKGEDVSWVLLPSRHRIQRLIDSLVISSSSSHQDVACVQIKSQFRSRKCYAVIGTLDDKNEMRELAATILADVAAHIDDVSNYPGAMRCISSLLQHQEKTEQTYRNRNSKHVPDDLPPHQGPIGPLTKLEYNRQERRIQRVTEEEERRHLNLLSHQKRMAIKYRHQHKSEGGTSTRNELVQQGLTILERLASNNDDNRRIICSAPGLLPKITAPVYSATFIQDVKTKAWADIVTSCLKVLYQLIRAPEGSHEIFSNNVQALSNLKSILELGNTEADHQELQLVAMKILTELALDPSINLTYEIKKVLVAKQLQLFLANGDGEEFATIAGRTIVSLTSNIESNSALILTTQDDSIGRLTGILDDENITRRTIAAEIIANLCARCNVDNMKENLLPKVLKKIMSIITESQQRKISDKEREEQEAFLSLAWVICDMLVDSADLDGAIQIAVQNGNNAGSEDQQRRREAFVDKLKTIIDGNCHPTADRLRIVMLCSQIAKSVMRCQQYVEILRNKGFKSSLSKASETMSELESCMLFVGTDFRLKKTVRPLFSEIEESFGEI